jgi:hypothetical protein
MGKLTHRHPTLDLSPWATYVRKASMCAPCRSINRLTRFREEAGEVVLESAGFGRYMYRRSRPANPGLQPKGPVQSLRPSQIRRVTPDGGMDLVRWRHLLGQAVSCRGLAAHDSSDPSRRGRCEDLRTRKKDNRAGTRRRTRQGEPLPLLDVELRSPSAYL